MTRQEYWVLAEAIVRTELDETKRQQLLDNICKCFEESSDRFDPSHFLEVVKTKAVERRKVLG